MTDRYLAKSASSKTENWPFWFVADTRRDGLNVMEAGRWYSGKFDTEAHARSLAEEMNNASR